MVGSVSRGVEKEEVFLSRTIHRRLPWWRKKDLAEVRGNKFLGGPSVKLKDRKKILRELVYL